MYRTLVCPHGHATQVSFEETRRQIRCSQCQAVITDPGADAGPNSLADSPTTLISDTDRFETHSVRETPQRTLAVLSQMAARRQLVLAVAVVAAGVVATITWFVFHNFSTQPLETADKTLASAGAAGAMSPGAGVTGAAAASSETDVRYPRLPGAMSRLPDSLERDCPFDVSEFSPEIPWDENAAPLYLEAFVEFSIEAVCCFPPERQETLRQRCIERSRAFDEFLRRWNQDIDRFANEREEKDNAALDNLLAKYGEGLRKLAVAQRRQRCLFASGWNFSALLPHVQCARQASRILILRAIRELDRGRIDGAIESLEISLRMSRDLRPRGVNICQVVSVALNNVSLRSIAGAILRAPGCTNEHCDRMLVVLQDHLRSSLDSWTTGLKCEYMTLRLIIDQVEHRTGDFEPDQLAEIMGAFGDSASRPTPGHILSFVLNGGGNPNLKEVDAINTRLQFMTEQEFHQEAQTVVEWYRAFEPIGRLPRDQQQSVLPQIQSQFKNSMFLPTRQSALPSLLVAFRRDETTLRGTVCLVALKRWQLANPELPPDLAMVLGDADVTEVPIDPYSGEPFLLGIVGGKPVIYSIGADGVDDHGEFDNLDGRNETGDTLFRLP